MVSFTNLFVLMFIAGAAGVLLGYIMPWMMIAVALYNSLLLWLALFDYLFTKPSLEAIREYDDRAGLGRPLPVKLLFVNKCARTLRIEAEDTPPEESSAAGTLRATLSLPPHSSGESVYTITPRRRGDLPFGALHVRIRGRLGLIRRRFELSPEQALLRVFPDVSEFRKYELSARRGSFYLPGQRRVRLHGRGTVFERLREYQPDDDSQDINWKATARVARPVVMEYEIEKNQNIFLAIDAGRLMGLDIFGHTKLDHALRAAMVLAAVSSLKGDNAGLLAFSKDVLRFVPPGRGRTHLGRCMDAMYNIQPTRQEPDYNHAFDYLLEKKLKRSLIVVFSDFVDLHSSQTLINRLSALHPAHLPMLVTLRDSDIEDAAAEIPSDIDGVFRKTTALAMLEKRDAVFHRLSRRGVTVINARPEMLSSDLIRKYLELKTRLMV